MSKKTAEKNVEEEPTAEKEPAEKKKPELPKRARKYSVLTVVDWLVKFLT